MDMLGPGSPAWEQFDKAIIAWRQCESKGVRGTNATRRTSKAMKAYFNHRAEMTHHVRKHGGNVVQWQARLDMVKNDESYNP